MAELETRVARLKEIVREADGENAAGPDFRREVEALIDAFYEDLGAIRTIDLNRLFDLFLIKTLYVERHSRSYEALDYLGRMLTRYLFTRELFPIAGKAYFLSDVLSEMDRPSGHFQNSFEAYRRFGDNALFVTGIFASSLRRPRRKRHGMLGAVAPLVDESYYVSTGRAFYRLASEHDLAEETEQRELLARLADYFSVYREALNEASERYILGFDMPRIADLMLDQFNAYRRTNDERHLESARKYAAILKLDRANFPSLFRSKARAVILDAPAPEPSS
ncbi:MAG TPA: hypothetical protein VFZ12_00485 [Dehalococcoidia bacterium]|nr:hypothetical protein [Dehalococcoidia bacterium]